MKVFKKVSALLLSLGMAASLMAAVPVKAAAPTKGSIIVHKYVVETTDEYNALKAKGDCSKGNVINFAEHEDLKNLKPMAGIQFELQKVEDDGTSVLTPETATLVGKPITGVTKDDGTCTFADLELGTYKLSELEDPRVAKKMDPVLITVPTYNQEHKTDTNKPEFLYDIHVYPKNLIHQDGPLIEKDVVKEENNDATVDRYAPFNWIILSDIPADVAGENQTPKKYVIMDKLDPRLDFVRNISVELRSADKQNKITLNEDTDYTFTAEKLDGKDYKPDNQSNLTWTLTATGLQKLKNYANGDVVTTFSTKLNEKADLGTAIPNQASLDYINWNGHEYLPKSDIPEVHTGGVKIEKVDKADHNKKLKGAEFMVYRSEAEAKEGNASNAVQRNGEAYVVTSGSDGIAFFDGLSYGNLTGNGPTTGSTEYWIVETKAPIVNGEQYNRLLDPFKVTVTATSHNANPEGMYVVYNAKDNYELPFTGGTGLLVFLGVGAVLLVTANIVSKGGKNKAAK